MSVHVGRDELIADVDLYLTSDYVQTGKVIIVSGDDSRAAFLLARKGDAIPQKTAKRLGITEDLKVAEIQRAPRTIAPEDIATRSKRPEKPTDTR